MALPNCFHYTPTRIRTRIINCVKNDDASFAELCCSAFFSLTNERNTQRLQFVFRLLNLCAPLSIGKNLTPTSTSPSVARDDNKDDNKDLEIQKWSQWRRFHSYVYTSNNDDGIRYLVGGGTSHGVAAICIGDGLMRKAGPTGTNRQWSRSIFLLFCVTHSSTLTRLVYLVQQSGILLCI